MAMKSPTYRQRLTLRALAAMLGYPGAELRAAMPEIIEAIEAERVLKPGRLAELAALARQLAQMDPFEAETRYVDTFDRGRATSLHLFEHVHGDSRERGPALVDLGQTYERAGLVLEGEELPDHLPVVLEFASTQPDAAARDFLAEMAHILNAVFSALRERESPYASVIAAVLELAGEKVQAVPVAPEPEVDEAWAEPSAFDGCSTRGQARPDTPQPIHIVRKSSSASTQQGASL
ncbi:nitrate reductase molybdenum cofactor assembly chaperone [Ideonella sp.]|uniref:nitrate reductase molybdenum cofactor assembly chaperone n=1 Tax=Ideonella sp. TaxID=1929293 RepID=UPI002B478D38|nr:nitrate reductase molybdenum cofactor assembly chaperone [Ideonella sp.]HJV70056.1 nitrate reductase molybdenum cofactor assembly chaperone [Ideonella sp.]